MEFSNLEESLKSKRFSDISTVEADESSDEEFFNMCQDSSEMNPRLHSQLFDSISEEKIQFYSRLSENLQSIYSCLELEIEPVCIRDECTVHAKNISLNTTSDSFMRKRRNSTFKLPQ